jgi:hypothetical protein
MSEISIIDQNGVIEVIPGTIQAIKGDNPAYRARIALALGQGTWLYALSSGHQLNQFNNVKASQSNFQNWQKSAIQYLKPYGAIATDVFLARGVEGLTTQVNQETIYGTAPTDSAPGTD